MEHQVSICATWNGDPITSHNPVQLTLTRCSDGKHLVVKVDAPLFNDPEPPNVPPGRPCPRLWDYEVVEIFFLGDDVKYLEVELCPDCNNWRLARAVAVTQPAARLHVNVLIYVDQLDLEFVTEKRGNRWTGEAKIPLDYFPPNVSMMNAYAIHGSGESRQYFALYPATKDFEEPDFLYSRITVNDRENDELGVYFIDVAYSTTLRLLGFTPIKTFA